MVRNDEGLTKTYNRFHDPDERDPEILKLRELHAAMDRAVLDAYGWSDIPTDCEFLLDYEIDEEEWGDKKKPYRYRWPDEVRDEVLARLLELNAERAKEEARSGAAAAKKPRQEGGGETRAQGTGHGRPLLMTTRTESTAPADSLEVRARLVEALKLDLVGPWAGHALAEERLPGWVRPSNWYLTGFLIPSGTPPEKSADADEDDDFERDPGVGGPRRGVERGAQGREEGLLPLVDGLELPRAEGDARPHRDRALGRLRADGDRGRRRQAAVRLAAASARGDGLRCRSPGRAIRWCTTSPTPAASSCTSSSG